MWVVMRAYVNTDGTFSRVFPDGVTDTKEQAIGEACKKALAILSNTKGGRLERSDRQFRVFSASGEVRLYVATAPKL